MIEFTQFGDPHGAVDDTLTLPYARRQKRRQRIILDQGEPAAVVLNHDERPTVGAVLQTADGYRVRVIAALEEVSMLVTDNAFSLARASYHLGNRHVAVQIDAGSVRYECDHVLDEMMRGLGLPVTQELATFEPEAGAYAAHQHTPRSDAHKHSHHSHE